MIDLAKLEALAKAATPGRLPKSFWARTQAPANGGACWTWTGVFDKGGYARLGFKVNGKSKNPQAYRLAYERLRGSIPDGLVCDHACNNPGCVNPWHIDIVTPRANILRSNCPPAINARKTHCYRGHQLSPENLYKTKRGRVCKLCGRIYSKIRVPQKRRPRAA